MYILALFESHKRSPSWRIEMVDISPMSCVSARVGIQMHKRSQWNWKSPIHEIIFRIMKGSYTFCKLSPCSLTKPYYKLINGRHYWFPCSHKDRPQEPKWSCFLFHHDFPEAMFQDICPPLAHLLTHPTLPKALQQILRDNTKEEHLGASAKKAWEISHEKDLTNHC